MLVSEGHWCWHFLASIIPGNAGRHASKYSSDSSTRPIENCAAEYSVSVVMLQLQVPPLNPYTERRAGSSHSATLSG